MLPSGFADNDLKIRMENMVKERTATAVEISYIRGFLILFSCYVNTIIKINSISVNDISIKTSKHNQLKKLIFSYFIKIGFK